MYVSICVCMCLCVCTCILECMHVCMCVLCMCISDSTCTDTRTIDNLPRHQHTKTTIPEPFSTLLKQREIDLFPRTQKDHATRNNWHCQDREELTFSPALRHKLPQTYISIHTYVSISISIIASIYIIYIHATRTLPDTAKKERNWPSSPDRDTHHNRLTYQYIHKYL